MSNVSHPNVPQGINSDQLNAWFAKEVFGETSPRDLRYELIAGGHSNLTFRVLDDATSQAWVLRRPPMGNVLATAHDMGREHKLMSALAGSAVPVPKMLGFCEDSGVNGAPFYVMELVEGHVVREAHEALALSAEARANSGTSLATVLAALHAVDIDAVGLGDLAKREGYIERQLRRWLRQFHDSKTGELPVIDKVHSLLSASIPPQQGVSLVHADYRLDNCILDDGGNVKAVLDWELCTLGDALADVGVLMAYWTNPDDEVRALEDSPTIVEGFSSREEVVAVYAKASGRDVSNVDYYLAFCFWRLACILEGVYSRYLAGAMGDKTPKDLSGYRVRIDRIAHEAHRIARSL